MCIQQSRKLYRNLLPSPRWPLDLRRFRNVSRHRKADPAQQLNAFRDGIDQFCLFAVMFVVQKMKLVESWTSHLPVRFLIKIADRNRVGKQLVQPLGHLQADWFLEFEWQVMQDGTVLLY